MERHRSRRCRPLPAGKSKSFLCRLIPTLVLLAIGMLYIGSYRFLAEDDSGLIEGAAASIEDSENSHPDHKTGWKWKPNTTEIQDLVQAMRSEQARVKMLSQEVKLKREGMRMAQEHVKRLEHEAESKLRSPIRSPSAGRKVDNKIADLAQTTHKGMINTLQNVLRARTMEFDNAKKKLAKENSKLLDYEKNRRSMIMALRGQQQPQQNQEELAVKTTDTPDQGKEAHAEKGDD